MARRSIADDEIALIKTLIARGTRNRDIQFLFNRPSRAVNTGRISGIAKGTYSNSAEIAPADDELLDTFLRSRTATPGEPAATAVPASSDRIDDGPLSDATLRGMFCDTGTGGFRLREGETDRHECKAGFGFRHAHKWLRAIAALANNKGGYIFFGVDDATQEVVGMTDGEFERSDASRFATSVRNTFDPTPEFSLMSTRIGEKTIGVIYVLAHPGGPVIARCINGDIKEGDIYYRYPGQSQRIKYSDLRVILDRRDAFARAQILPMVERLLALGPRQAMVADLASGELSDGRTSIHLSKDLIEEIAFIREGEFDEVAGKPTLRVVGSVTVGDAPEVSVKGAICRKDVLEAFLSREKVQDPKGYLGFVVDGCSGEWLPLRHFAVMAGLSVAEAKDFIASTTAPGRRKKLFQDSLDGRRTAFVKNSYSAAGILKSILSGEEIDVPDLSGAVDIARALQGLPEGANDRMPEILALMSSCLRFSETDPNGAAGSVMRRAIARLDEVLHPLT